MAPERILIIWLGKSKIIAIDMHVMNPKTPIEPARSNALITPS